MEGRAATRQAAESQRFLLASNLHPEEDREESGRALEESSQLVGEE